MKKVLYITFESLENDSILHSQVVSLVKQLNNEYLIDIITFDSSQFIKQYPASTGFIFFKRRSYLLSVFTLTAWLFKHRKRYHLLHIRSYLPMFAVAIFRLFIDIPIIFDMRGVMAHEFLLRSKSSTSFSKKLQYYISFLVFLVAEKLFINICDAIVVVSHPFYNYVQRWNFRRSPIHVIPTFIEPIRDTSSHNQGYHFFDSSHNTFVYSGSIDVWQQFPKVLELFSYIYKFNPHSRLLVLTPQVEKAAMLVLGTLPAGSYHITKVKSSEVKNILSLCDYGILLRENNLVNLVAAPIKFAEYIASRLKVIITDNIGDASEHVTINDFGLILENLESATIIDFVKTNTDKLKCKEKLPPHKVKALLDSTYSLETATSRYKDLYISLI
ncbi:glycosyltransferase [Telluribacter humicola]